MTDSPSHARVSAAIRNYRSLLEDFVDGRIDGEDFETSYTAIYLAEKDFWARDVADIVDGFFADVDAFVSDPRLFEPSNGDLNEAELRLRARQLLDSAGG